VVGTPAEPRANLGNTDVDEGDTVAIPSARAVDGHTASNGLH
jgi:hypothetical protein